MTTTPVELIIYGTRGGCPRDTPEYTQFGLGTSSYTLRHGNIVHFLDAGTSVERAMREQLTPDIEKAYLELTHGHVDHMYMGCTDQIYGNKIPGGIRVIGYAETVAALRQLFDNERLWPVPQSNLQGLSTDIMELQGGETVYNSGYTIRTHQNYHPSKGMGGSIGFRFDITKSKDEKVSVAYTTDLEFDFKPGMQVQENAAELKRNYQKFIAGADVLLVDTEHTKEEYFETKPFVRGWGHPYLEQIIELAGEAKVKHIIGTHHNKKHTDEMLTRIEQWGREYARANGFTGEVNLARSGMRISL
ncbi:MAG TPA: MBL fold metallo-hydrolase [Candidatus Nanoarchaeia archaeon]|nr:MBL fold metallo-hydrolase [Candidatus Nanoarchaeia archaeon]